MYNAQVTFSIHSIAFDHTADQDLSPTTSSKWAHKLRKQEKVKKGYSFER